MALAGGQLHALGMLGQPFRSIKSDLNGYFMFIELAAATHVAVFQYTFSVPLQLSSPNLSVMKR